MQQKEAQTLGSSTSNTKISNSSSSRNESGVKRKKPSVSSMNTLWKQLQAAGELPDGFSFSFGTASRGMFLSKVDGARMRQTQLSFPAHGGI